MSYTIADSAFFRLAERIDPDLLGAMGIVSTVMMFALLIISIVTVCKTIQNLSLARMQNKMINQLLVKGYSVDEIHQLVSGNRKNVLFRFFDRRRQTYVSRQPSPPVKSSV